MPSGDLRLEGKLVEINKPVFLKTPKYYATQITIETDKAKMPLTILGYVPKRWLNMEVNIQETYKRKINKRIVQQIFCSKRFPRLVYREVIF